MDKENRLTNAMIDRLADYENTGLSPEEIIKIYQEWSHYLNFVSKMNAIENAVDDIYDDGKVDYKRLHELALADKEGRCVMLPSDDYTLGGQERSFGRTGGDEG